MKKLPMIILSIAPLLGLSQASDTKDYEGGKLELGLRTTISAFGGDGFLSTGAGGHFRLRFGSRLNSEWFADYITSDLSGLGRRTDAHIGWSVMAYPFTHEVKDGAWLPYILGGHCFDYTEIRKTPGDELAIYQPYSRWSSAIHLGSGVHFYPVKNFNLSLAAQYMLHFGNDINAKIIDNPTNPGNDYLFVEQGDFGLEGHLFISLSANVYIADLWSRKENN